MVGMNVMYVVELEKDGTTMMRMETDMDVILVTELLISSVMVQMIHIVIV